MFPFATIYEKYYLKYVFYAYKFIKDYQLAEDAVQEAAIKIMHRSFEKVSHGDALFITCIKHRCINMIERDKIRFSPTKLYVKQKFEDEDGDIEGMDRFIDYEDIYQEMDAAEIKTEVIYKIYEQIESLPFKRREIFKLHYLEDKTNSEICNTLGLSLPTVKNQLTNALKEIRITFNSKYRTKKAL